MTRIVFEDDAAWETHLAEVRAEARHEVASAVMHEMNNERPDYIRYGNIVAILAGQEPTPWVESRSVRS